MKTRFAFCLALTTAAMLTAAPAAQDEELRQRRKSQNNLKQIGLAMHNYHAANGKFPADVVDGNGKALLSWRVLILPYIEQNNLYKQFKLDEAWDGDHNKKLLATIPHIYMSPLQKAKEGRTTYLGPRGKDYLFNPDAKGQGRRIADITDGTSNTVMVVEANDEKAVEWTKPGDWEPNAADPAKDLLGHFHDGFNALFCDGSVRFINKSINAKTLNAILTISGGEVVDKIP